MSRFWSDVVKGLTPYVPGEQPRLANLVKLNTNENPYGPSPHALQAIRDATGESLKLYPDPNAGQLKFTIAQYHSIDARNVFVGNGSDEVLAHIFLGLMKQARPILFPDITYSFYPVYCGLYQVGFETIPLADDFSIRVSDYAKPNGGIIFPNPNAPTGCLVPLAGIETLLQANPDSVVVIDEAYVDFGGESAIPLAYVDREQRAHEGQVEEAEQAVRVPHTAQQPSQRAQRRRAKGTQRPGRQHPRQGRENHHGRGKRFRRDARHGQGRVGVETDT